MASLEEDNASASEEEENEDQDEDMEDADDNADADETMADADNDEDDDNDNDDNDDDENQDDFEDSPLKNRPRIAQRGYSSAQISTRDGSPGNEDSDSRVRSKNNDDAPTSAVPISRPARIHRGEELPFRPTVKEEMVKAKVYDIVPTIAAPHSTSINAITATPDMKWVFSGGSDGWIRKFHWPDTVNSKAMLTVAQRHPFVDSVVKAGVLTSYWENEEPPDKTDGQAPDEAPSLSPVYSLAVHHQSLWLLSGTEVGAINLMAVRHGEGKRITSLWQHSSAVSVMKLSHDERGLLSGSWDKTILDWDLNTGQVKRSFTGSASQISAIEMRPVSSVPVPNDTYHQVMAGTTTAAERKAAAQSNAAATQQQQPNAEPGASPMGSLFGGDDDSLFGDTNAAPSGGVGFGADDDDDEFSRAIASETQQERHEQQQQQQQQQQKKAHPSGDAEAAQKDSTVAAPEPEVNGNKPAQMDGEQDPPSEKQVDDQPPPAGPATPFTPSEGNAEVSEQIFMDSAIDGMIRVWDRRQQNPVARIVPGPSVPPWCTSAVWSPDGCYIYAGRRNNTVEEYSLHKGLKDPTRTLKLPGGSGAVSALHPMANGKNLLCASFDILRLYDLTDTESEKHGRAPFLIVPGHRTGVVSQLYVDPTSSHLISTGGNRGWAGSSTEVLLGYEINPL